MNDLTTQHAQLIVHAVAPGHRLLSSTPAAAAYTNSVHILRCVSPSGSEIRLAVKRMTDDPDPERADGGLPRAANRAETPPSRA